MFLFKVMMIKCFPLKCFLSIKTLTIILPFFLCSVTVYNRVFGIRNCMAFSFELKKKKYFPVVIGDKISFEEKLKYEEKKFFFQWAEKTGESKRLESVAEPNKYLAVENNKVTIRHQIQSNPTYFRIHSKKKGRSTRRRFKANIICNSEGEEVVTMHPHRNQKTQNNTLKERKKKCALGSEKQRHWGIKQHKERRRSCMTPNKAYPNTRNSVCICCKGRSIRRTVVANMKSNRESSLKRKTRSSSKYISVKRNNLNGTKKMQLGC
nr:uncharacterized protein LOC129439734 [Misgurnus anguillicaudatus]